jgi:hypothetical protein
MPEFKDICVLENIFFSVANSDNSGERKLYDRQKNQKLRAQNNLDHLIQIISDYTSGAGNCGSGNRNL